MTTGQIIIDLAPVPLWLVSAWLVAFAFDLHIARRRA
jgi:hypothetical protein